MTDITNSEIKNHLDELFPKIIISIAPQINFACHQNSVPLIRDISIANDTTEVLKGLTLRMDVSPGFVVPKTWHVASLLIGAEINISDRDTTLNGKFLLELTESMRGEVTFSLLQDEAEIAKTVYKVEILARNEWGGYGAQPELLAAFSMPNDPAIDNILSQSVDVLRRGKKRDMLDGYVSGKRTRSWEVVSAIWSVLGNLELKYSYPPKSFEQTGQKIRTPSMIMSGRLATCMDTTMLFCSAIEQAGLYPIVILKDGHSFLGVWLQPDSFRSVVTDDVTALRKRISLNELIVFETTLITQSPVLPFSAAIEHGKKQLVEEVEAGFVCAIDIQRAREQRIKPLSFVEQVVVIGDDKKIGVSTLPVLDEAPVIEDFAKPDTSGSEEASRETRLERWQRKLLDLSLRNPLLKFRPSLTAIPIVCPDPGLLEDKLADGKKINLLPLPTMTMDEGRDGAIHGARTGKNLDEAFVSSALERHEIYVREEKTKLETRLIALYRKAKGDLEEGGANTLFLVLGFLVWKREDKKDRKFRAPLILVPVELKRKSVRSGVKLVLHDDEPRFNTTLLEMLRQDMGLDIQGLDGELPTDQSGVDVAGIWNKIRLEVKNIEGFEVTEEVVLGTFSFAKYLMWKDLVDRTDQLKENPVVRHLIETPRDPYTTNLEFPEPRELDRLYEPEELFTPLPADSSQLSAVIAAGQGKDFVIIGPPGSGKSQSIANMIAHLMGSGKTVLFVSEKAAALNVVYRRLKEVNLGDFCLELHSNKAKKMDVINQFRSAWDVADHMTKAEWVIEACRLKKLRDELNEYVKCLHAVHSNGLTVHKAIGLATKNIDIPDIDLSYPEVNQHTIEGLKQLREHVHALKISAEKLEDVVEHPLKVIAQTDWSNAWQHEIIALAEKLALSARQLLEATKVISTHLHVDGDGLSLIQVQAFSALAKSLTEAYGLKLAFSLEADGHKIITDAEAASGLLVEYARIRECLSVEYTALPWQRIAAEDLSEDWKVAENSWWPKSFFGRSKIRKILVEEAGAKRKPDPDVDLKTLLKLQKCGVQIEELDKKISTIPDWNGFDTDLVRLDKTLDVAKRLRSGIFSITDDTDKLLSLKGQVKKLVDEGNELLGEDGAVGRSLKRAAECQKNYENTLAEFSLKAAQSLDEVVSPQTNGLAEVVTLCENIVENKNRLNEWCSWRHVRNLAIDSGLKPLVDALENGVLAIERLEDGFDASYCRWWVEKKMDADDILRGFNSSLHQDKIEQFKVLDDQVRSLASRYVRMRICSQIPQKNGVKHGSEYGMLRRILEQKRPRKSLRDLITEMPNALTQLTPCVLMSPLSISQYLSVEQKAFDVVIFDEASQITVWDAIGSIARAGQTIVAGDPKQLPPTSFFGRSDDESEDVDEGDLESILDEMLGAGIPTRHLAWHYRSEHESLITFSNHKYYGGNLITFPSPTLEDRAVRLVRVNGIYQKGGGRTNREEADAIVTEIVRRLKDHIFNEKKRTIGVVTFNAEQQRLIENLLDEERRHHPDIERHFDEGLIEPVFVKNLESVQGDERDIILFSTTYGPDASGKISMNFGPLNREGGERRLNVAITRARSEMIVFSSLGSDDIDLSRTSATGVRDLKHFLDFANRGVKALGEAVYGSQGDFDSPFEVAVARGLQERGWTVHPQIGVSAFRVDIGVVHPDFPGRYLIGVECDGATYHRSATARDRDKVREEILLRLGWNLLRLWSTDFWVDGKGELDRLDREIQDVLGKERAKRAAKEATEKEEVAKKESPCTPAYQEDMPITQDVICTIPEKSLRPESLVARPVSTQNDQYKITSNRIAAKPHGLFAAEYKNWVSHPLPDPRNDGLFHKVVDGLIEIIEAEGPMYCHRAYHLYAHACGIHKVGRSIRAIFNRAVNRGVTIGKLLIDKQHGASAADGYLNCVARVPDTPEIELRTGGGRTLEEIPLDEMAALMDMVAKQFSIHEEEQLFRKALDHYKIKRLTSKARSILETAKEIIPA